MVDKIHERAPIKINLRIILKFIDKWEKVCYTNVSIIRAWRCDMAGTYKTAGRQRLLDFLQSNPDRQFPVDELNRELNLIRGDEAGHSSKSSLYRHLSELCDEGSVRKYRSDSQSAYVYQYVGRGDCCHHFHLKCVSCGTLVHLECTVSEELLAHIRSDHHFRVDSGRSILYGVCENCVAENERDGPCSCDHCHEDSQ